MLDSNIEYCLADRKLQMVELHMLKALHEICMKNGLSYYLIGGTMLGAVRHKGFIPWDDDIDVGLPREDYEILLANADKWFPSHLKLCHWKNTAEYVYNFAKLEHLDTLLVEKPYEHLTRRGGVFIDIFPLDGMPCGKYQRYFHFALVRFLVKFNLLMYCQTSIKQVAWSKRETLKAILGKVCQLLFSRKKVHIVCEKIMALYSMANSSFIAIFEGNWGWREVIPSEAMGRPTLIDFEGFMFYSAERPDLYLAWVYGDYMRLPPVEKRCTHHNFIHEIKANCRSVDL